MFLAVCIDSGILQYSARACLASISMGINSSCSLVGSWSQRSQSLPSVSSSSLIMAEECSTSFRCCPSVTDYSHATYRCPLVSGSSWQTLLRKILTMHSWTRLQPKHPHPPPLALSNQSATDQLMLQSGLLGTPMPSSLQLTPRHPQTR